MTRGPTGAFAGTLASACIVDRWFVHGLSANRKRLQKALAVIEEQIAAGTFDYAATFPGSKNAHKVADRPPTPAPAAPPEAAPKPIAPTAMAAGVVVHPTPSFSDFTTTWLSEHRIECWP